MLRLTEVVDPDTEREFLVPVSSIRRIVDSKENDKAFGINCQLHLMGSSVPIDIAEHIETVWNLARSHERSVEDALNELAYERVED